MQRIRFVGREIVAVFVKEKTHGKGMKREKNKPISWVYKIIYVRLNWAATEMYFKRPVYL